MYVDSVSVLVQVRACTVPRRTRIEMEDRRTTYRQAPSLAVPGRQWQQQNKTKSSLTRVPMQSSPMWRRAPSISSSQDSLCLHEKQKQLHSLKLDVEKEYEDLRQRIRTKLSHSQLLKLKHCSKRAKSASSHVIPPGSNVHRHSAQPWRDAGRTSAHQFARSAPRLVHDFIPFRALQARPPLQVRNSKSMGLLQPRLLPQARFTKQDSPQDQAEALLQALKQEAPRRVDLALKTPVSYQ